MEKGEFIRRVRAAWTFTKDQMAAVRSVASLVSLPVDEDFRRLALDPSANYRSIYLIGLSRSHYNILLNDFAYFQFSWTGETAWRLAFYPNPWITGVPEAELRLADWEAAEAEGLLSGEDVDELISEMAYEASVPPIRFEYATDQYREIVHPAAHFHIGRHSDNRWPSARLLDPLSFTMMIAKLYYGPAWRRISRFHDESVQHCQDEALMEALVLSGRVHDFSEVERRTVHFEAR